jgi:acyl-CoA dehydrogenase
MTEPAVEGGAGSDPSMMQTTAVQDGNHWVINGRKAFITGARGAKVGIIMAKSTAGACMFLVDLPDPAIRIDRVLNTIDSSMPGGHAILTIDNLRVPADQMLGQNGEGFKYAQVRLSPARLSHCMRWFGAAKRANDIATAYAVRRQAFGKPLIDHEGVGFMLADNLIDLKQAELMIDWCADVLDTGVLGTTESSMAKVAVSEALFRVADRCVQTMGGTGVSGDTIVEQVFREIRAFRIYDGPTEVGGFNGSAQHLLILLDQEVAHGDITDMVHGDAEGRAVGALEERVKCCSDLPGTGSEEQDWRSANCDAPWRNRAGAPPESFGSAKA